MADFQVVGSQQVELGKNDVCLVERVAIIENGQVKSHFRSLKRGRPMADGSVWARSGTGRITLPDNDEAIENILLAARCLTPQPGA